MQAFATEVITRAALAAGLPEGRVMAAVKKDNLTIDRPRVEMQFLPEKYTRTGRKLGVSRETVKGEDDTEKLMLVHKRELYVVELPVNVNVLSEDREWLERFSYAFVEALPRGGNDSRGNWVKIQVRKATFSRPPDKRVGDAVIEVFTRASRLFVLTFTGRITTEEREDLIPSFTINPHIRKA